ncbi:sugar phosphate isomerase/epimerase family protein [Paenibacillus yanchengensis]|uniref:Sugar phosphate isomerase/epimerase family protein n=1 Tax=Paenibacillus yanchengensis TaxID=2035833 RepID=A0ABW4YQ91_9BACL
MTRMNIGLQMYTLREALAEDFEGTLRKVAAIGYEGVEFAGYGGMDANSLKNLLDELQIKAIGSHVPLTSLLERLDEEIEYMKVIGGKYIVCPWLPVDERDEAAWEGHVEAFRKIGEKVAAAGLVFAYHNHDFEFHVKMDGQPVFDALYSKIDAAHLQVEMDIGWVQYAGNDPLAYIRKYSGRLPLLHLKDYQDGSFEQSAIATVELGRGKLALNDIIQVAEESEVEWIIVEQDICMNPPLEAVAESFEWVKNNYMNK